MSTLKNKVQLIGNVGNTPATTTFDSGKKATRFSLVTNESYTNAKGTKVQHTEWHNVIAWGKQADIIERYATRGKEIAIEGKLTSRTYETNEGEKRYVTEVMVREILLLGSNKNNDV